MQFTDVIYIRQKNLMIRECDLQFFTCIQENFHTVRVIHAPTGKWAETDTKLYGDPKRDADRRMQNRDAAVRKLVTLL